METQSALRDQRECVLRVLVGSITITHPMGCVPLPAAAKAIAGEKPIDFQKINFQWHIKNPQLFGKVEGHHTSYKHDQINRG